MEELVFRVNLSLFCFIIIINPSLSMCRQTHRPTSQTNPKYPQHNASLIQPNYTYTPRIIISKYIPFVSLDNWMSSQLNVYWAEKQIWKGRRKKVWKVVQAERCVAPSVVHKYFVGTCLCMGLMWRKIFRISLRRRRRREEEMGLMIVQRRSSFVIGNSVCSLSPLDQRPFHTSHNWAQLN